MACTLMTHEEAVRLRMLDDAARHTRACRTARVCVWCAEPVAEHRVYPACEDCRDYKGVVAS